MAVPAAARQGDPIAHTSMMAMIGKVGAGLLVGAAMGFLAGAAATALVAGTVLSGGLLGVVAVAVISGLMLHAVGANSIIESASNAVGDMLSGAFPPTVEGTIMESSPNVFINGKAAARAVESGSSNEIVCQKHAPMPKQYLAEGSDNVYINSFPAHRVGDRTTCDAKTSKGSPDVFIGGGTKQTREITSEMPWWLNAASLAIGIALAVCTRDWKKALINLGCLGLNFGVNFAIESAFGKPVHAATGAKLLGGSDDTDFALPARIPLEWTRFYSSIDTRDGIFGQGWSVPISVQLRVNQPGEHPNIFIDLQGREIPFDAVDEGQSIWNSAEGWRLARTLGGSYVVEGLDGLYREFGMQESDAPHTLSLQRIEDANANYIALRYDGTGKLQEMADCAGRLYRCEYDQQHTNRIAAIHLHLHRSSVPTATLARYRYDHAGRLVEVINANNETTRRFTWHDSGPGAGLIASHTLPTGLESYYEWANFADHPRVVVNRTNDGERWEAVYQLFADDTGGTTTVTDHLGRQQIWEWNVRKQITSYTDALGRRTEIAWNADGQIASCTQPNGGIWKYEYDERGNLKSEIDPLGRKQSTVWRADIPLPESETDAAGRKRVYEYDDRNNLIAEDGSFGRLEIGRDRYGQAISVTDPRGGVTHRTWHDSGQVLSYEDCSGRVTSYHYDMLGLLSSETDAAGNMTTYRRDRIGRVETVVRADNVAEHWHWSPAGLLTEHLASSGRQTRYNWNRQGRLAVRVDATGNHVKYEYDGSGNLIALFNENGQAYGFERDAAGQLTAQTGLDGLRSIYRLNELGQPVEVKQAANTDQETVIKLERDLLGRLLAKITPETVTRYTYDAFDQLTLIERFDAAKEGQAGEIIDSIAFAHDARGYLIEETSTQYRANGKTLEKPRSRTIKHDYDALGNRTATELPQQRTLNYLYYGSGHLHQINFDGDIISDIERNAVHSEISRSQGALLSHYQRDALGRRTAQRAFYGRDSGVWGKNDLANSFPAAGDPTLRRMARPQQGDVVLKGYRYDSTGELEQRIDPLQGLRSYSYDKLGRITSAHTDAANDPGHIDNQPEQFAWDPASNLLPYSGSDKLWNNRITVHQDKRYEYDAKGRLVNKKIGRHAEIRLIWNDEDQLIASNSTRNGVTQRTAYDYDALGRRIAKHDGFGSTWFNWEGMRLLQEERGSVIATHVYEPGSYAPLARIDLQPDLLAGAQDPGNPPPVNTNVYYFHTNINGAPEEMTNRQGTLVWRARYAVWGNAITEEWHPQHRPNTSGLSATNPLPQNLRMQGQYYDTETGLCYNTFRYYDADVGRFISQDPIGLAGGMNLYQFASNPISWIDPWGWVCTKAFNRRNRITSRWVEILTGKKPGEVDALLKSKGYTSSVHRTSPNATPHTRYTRTTKAGDTDVLDYHPGGANAVHESDYWKVYRNGDVQGRIGYGQFTNYDRIFDSPVYVDGILQNTPK